MSIEIIIKKIQGLNGNFCHREGDIYISPINMESLVSFLENDNNISSILITPYLISSKNNTLYELHYYEFELEVLDIPQSHLIKYDKNNILQKEIVDKISPKAVVAKNDKDFFMKALKNYLKAMKTMTFEEEKNNNEKLTNSKLFYQIF